MTKVWMEGINGEAMDKFMADLRSGEFKQTTSCLADENGFCCLGVATDGAKDACGLTKKWVEGTERFTYIDPSGVHHRALMPKVVADYLGIPEKFIDGVHDDDVSIWLKAHDDESNWWATIETNKMFGFPVIGATVLNDTVGLNFDQIADRFEETFKVDKED